MKIIHMVTTLLLCFSSLLFAQSSKDDNQVIASSLYTKALKVETEDYDYAKAVEIYKDILSKAPDQSEFIAKALYRIGLCYEKMEPENINDAQSSYARIVSDYTNQIEFVKKAEEKIKLKGVDVYISQYKKILAKWRQEGSSDIKTLESSSNSIWEKIKKLDKEATYGLMSTLQDDDTLVRNFAAQKLSMVIDENGIAEIISRLNNANPNMSAGCSSAINYILDIYTKAEKLDAEATSIEEGLISIPATGGGVASNTASQLRDRAAGLHDEAQNLRHNIPSSLSKENIMSGLESILTNTASRKIAKIEASNVVATIHTSTPAIENALMSLLSGKDSELRSATALALGSIKPTNRQIALKILTELNGIVQYEPEKDTKPSEERDWSNDIIVRKTAAEALGRMNKINAIPSLIEALDDNDVNVRNSVNASLRTITDKDFNYRADDDKVERDKAIESWSKWWTATDGIEVLVERFRVFAQKWKDYLPAKLFDKNKFLNEIKDRTMSAADQSEILKRAEAAYNMFYERKKVYEDDISELGIPTVIRLYNFIGGEALDGKLNDSAVRLFISETIATIVNEAEAQEKGSCKSTIDQLRAIVKGENRESAVHRTGAALTIGRISKDIITQDEIDALGDGLISDNAELRAASAEALGLLDAKQSVDKLTTSILDSDPNVQIEVIIAIGKIKEKSPETINMLSTVIKEAKTPLPRRYAAETLGILGDIEGIPALLIARTNIYESVKGAAADAISKIAKANPEASKSIAEKLQKEPQSLIRKGAAYALGDTEDKTMGRILIYRLIDEDFPRKVKDDDPAVRSAVAKSLLKLKSTTTTVISGLIKALEDNSEDVRIASYNALKEIAKPTIDFNPKGKLTDRAVAIEGLRNWFSKNKDAFERD